MNTPTPAYNLIVEQFRAGEAHSDGLILTIGHLDLKLAAMTEQRDQLKNNLEKSKSYKNVMKRDNAELRKQRDRLAEALRECRDDSIELLGERDTWQRESRGDYQERYQATRDNLTRADAALATLNQPKP